MTVTITTAMVLTLNVELITYVRNSTISFAIKLEAQLLMSLRLVDKHNTTSNIFEGTNHANRKVVFVKID